VGTGVGLVVCGFGEGVGLTVLGADVGVGSAGVGADVKAGSGVGTEGTGAADGQAGFGFEPSKPLDNDNGGMPMMFPQL
jgi:hypothetical protein